MSIRGEYTSSELLAFTNSYTPFRNRSRNLSSPFTRHQAKLAPTLETKTAPGDPVTSSLALVYCAPRSTFGNPPQCSLCSELHAACPSIPKADRDRLIQIREMNFQARHAESQQRPSRSPASQSPVTGTATTRVVFTEDSFPSAATIDGCAPVASASKKEPGDV